MAFVRGAKITGSARAAKFATATPRLPVPDVEKALAFCIDKLGFQLGWKWGTPLTHANVCRDSISLDLINVPAQRCGTAMVYVQIAGVDAYFAELKRRAVDAGDVGDRPYGMRDFEVSDPDGNRLAFGEPVAGQLQYCTARASVPVRVAHVQRPRRA